MPARRLRATLSGTALLFLVACGNRGAAPEDRPRPIPGVTVRDVAFYSKALRREMRYRVELPATVAPHQRLRAVYLLHGGGGCYQDWSNYSDAGRFVPNGLLLVMPQGDHSYYVNAVERPEDRYEDYIVRDLLSDVESRFPVSRGRMHRAIAGVSMGGFGAVKIALSHPELFAFAGSLSAAIDVPSRPFSIKRIQQYRAHRTIFGPWGSLQRQSRDPFVIARSMKASAAPYLFLVCGNQEGLLPANRAFAALLKARSIPFEFHVAPGAHNWSQWNAQVPSLFARLLGILNR